ncbi:MAG: hypothetical protein WA857_19660 [Candidatus Acidiferrum sp.]
MRSAATSAAAAFRSFGFAALTPFWFVLETFVGEKHLFAGSKNKLSAAFRTLQDTIVVFHEPFSRCPRRGREMGAFRASGQGLKGNLSSGETGLGSLGPKRAKLQPKPNVSA